MCGDFTGTHCTVQNAFLSYGHALIRSKVVATFGQTNSGCIIEGGLLTQVQTHAMESSLTWLYYRGWPANTGPNTCYGDFGVQ